LLVRVREREKALGHVIVLGRTELLDAIRAHVMIGEQQAVGEMNDPDPPLLKRTDARRK